jgi:purine nucleoside permease
MRWFAIVGVLLCGLGGSVRAQTTQTPLPIRVVAVTMFEVGNDTTDTPVEFHNWVEKFPLPIGDTGALQALTWLNNDGRADVRRVPVLRAASNYSMQYPGETASQSLTHENAGGYSAYIPALIAAYRVGGTVAHELADHWDKYADHFPGGGP